MVSGDVEHLEVELVRLDLGRLVNVKPNWPKMRAISRCVSISGCSEPVASSSPGA